MTRRGIKDSWNCSKLAKEPRENIKAPEIAWTSACPQKEDHEKYSPPVSAAIKNS